jgi:hypothetical protein
MVAKTADPAANGHSMALWQRSTPDPMWPYPCEHAFVMRKGK